MSVDTLGQDRQTLRRPGATCGAAAVALLLVLSSASAFAQATTTVTVAWDHNSDAHTVGYTLYYGTSPGSDQFLHDAGNQTTAQLTLTRGSIYYLRLRAYNSAGQVGPPSNEVSVNLVDTAPPPTAQITATLQNPPTTALVSWQTTNAVSATINGQPVGLSGSTTVPISATTTYTLVATNAAGATATHSATIAPPPNVPPTVSLTAPSGGSVFNPGAAVTVRATASDTNGSVARVEFYAGTQLIASDATNPYEVTWTAGPVGPYSLTAVAVDNQNASTTSTAVPVSVVAAAGGGVNVALASNGATATASSSYYAAGYQPPAAIDGRRSGAIRGQLGTWEDASGALPDWLQVSFAGPSTINRVDVVSMQEAWSAPIEPTTTLTSGLAAENFDIQYWNGAAWVVVPGSQVVGNRLVWKQVSFAPVTTSAIRIVVTKVAGGITRLTEVEAWTSGSAPVPPPTNAPPTVSLTAPSGGSVFSPAAAVTVRATAGDTNGSVARVEFFAGTQLIGTDTGSPYEVTWTAGPPGSYSLTAVAVDNQNASTTSTAVPVSVAAATGGGVNVALAGSGATASASSTYTTDYAARAAIDGRRSGAIRGQLGTWEDSGGAVPDWFQVSFAAPSTINRVNVFSMQEAWSAPIEPTPTLTSGLAAEDFQVQYWNGAAWVVVPGSQVVGNRLVWRQVSFAPITTSAIRILVTKVAGGITRLTEVEAWTP